MPKIHKLSAREILDSRGRPTVEASCTLADGATGTASVPSGASTGRAEARELRDGEAARYGGLGCRKAVAAIEGEITSRVCGATQTGQAELDQALVALDGTSEKSRLGGNSLLAVSLAFARASAAANSQPLYAYFAALVEQPVATLPRPIINLFSGGKHAGGQVAIQDVMIVPTRANSIDELLATAYAVYQQAVHLTGRKYAARPLKADEGGLAPPCRNAEEMLADAVDCLTAAGLAPGLDASLAIDVAASHFFAAGGYALESPRLTSHQMIDRLAAWVERFPIVSLEDGLAENDWDHWPRLVSRLSPGVVLVGDDLLCTNAERIRRAIDSRAATGLLLKVNQVGTLTEAAEAWRLARSAGWRVTVSARSGETEDHWLADLAVGWGADHIKIGSIMQSERLAKYNRLLAIESETKLSFPVGNALRGVP